MKLHKTHILILFTLILTTLIFLIFNYNADKIFSSQPVIFGVSYSPRYAKELDLDPKQTYLSILDDLKVKNIRLSAYWDEIEPKENHFNFTDLDWYIEEASKRNTKVILAVGYKLPRWPECRAPKWLEKGLDVEYRQERQLLMLQTVIDYYNKNSSVTTFQLENEPLLRFGICPEIDREFLKKESKYVHTLTDKPIIITDTGELRFWKTPMELSDIFGTTLYRVVNTPLFGQFEYPLRPYFYRIKSDLIRKAFAPHNQKTIIAELQAEGWGEKSINTFPLGQFIENVTFARKTGFSESYFWGVEWWYYMEDQGHPEYLEYAHSLF